MATMKIDITITQANIDKAAAGTGWTITIDDPDEVVAEGGTHSGTQVTNPLTTTQYMVGAMTMKVNDILLGIMEKIEINDAAALRATHRAAMDQLAIDLQDGVTITVV